MPLSPRKAIELAWAQNPEQKMALMRVRQSEALFDQSLAGPGHPA
ncbi:MAG: hypothetical protein ACOZHQ_18900 [Thermodesulfobacteriota bacterium]